MSKKYELTDETTEVDGHTLHRIRAVRCFSDVKAGDIGGWVEKEDNLSKMGDAWVYENAEVYGNAKVHGDAEIYCNAKVFGTASVCGNAQVYGDAMVYDNARVFGNARVCHGASVFDNAQVYGDAMVYDNARVFGNAEVYGNAIVCGDAMVRCGADYIIFKNFWSSGRFFTWTRSNNMWEVGCFYGTGDELIKKAYKDSEKSGREYERVVRYVESILADEKKGGEK